ncbi:MAG TPA: response regulator [Candidatus Polarisedimenticolia bacterium]
MKSAFPTAAESRTPSILVVDDEPQVRDLLCQALKQQGYQVASAENGGDAVEKVRTARFDVLLCDLKMPGISGLQALEQVKAIDPDIEFIVMTAHGTLENAIESLRKGASDFLQKPLVFQDLYFSIGKALERRDLRERVGLFELSRSIFSTLEPETLHGRVLQSAIQVLRADDASLMLVDAAGRLRVALSTSLGREIQESAHLAIGERIAGRVALQSEPVVINADVQGDERFAGIASWRSIRASIVCPLTMRDQLLGVLNVNRVSLPERYTEHDRRNAMILASLVALALGNARLHKELEARLRQIEETQEEMIQNEKMLALGNLLSGVAHELNNPLCGVMGYAQLLQQTNTDPKTRKGVDVIVREAERAATIVNHLLTFARREKAQKKPLGLNGVVLKTIERKAYDLKVSRVGVRADLDPKLPLIMGDFHQMQVVFGNLVNNAQQAMFETNGRGTLTITSRPQGERIVVTLSDDGPGVPAENLRRVFDPFFTTREVGKGVGLGLSVCYAIVRDHGGTIRAMPNPEGQGATIVLEIPAARPEELEESGRAAEESRSAGQRLSGARILVADSEGHVQDLLVELLSGMGYRVDTADSGDAALAKIRSAEYDGLIADYALARLNGRSLLEMLRAEKPGLTRRVIFLASDAENPTLVEFASAAGVMLIGKPFDLDTLRAALRNLFPSPQVASGTVH